MALPPQSLHRLLCCWCSQIELPPQSLHWLFTRWCSQRPLPPQSLHSLLRRWYSQMLLPPQSLHVLLRRWCSQMLLPPQSLHLLLTRSCSNREGPCGASWLQKDVVPELSPGLMNWLGSHHALRACCAFLVALQMMCAPLAFSSCPPQQAPGHPCDPTHYSAAYPPCGGFLCTWCDASTPAWCSMKALSRSTRPLRSCKWRQYYRARSVAERQAGNEAVRHRGNKCAQR